MPPNPANIQTQQTLPIYTTPAPQPRSVTCYKHPITNNFIRGPPPTNTNPSATSIGLPNRSSVFDTPNLEPQTPTVSFLRVTRVTRMTYSPSLWLMAIGWWNKINQCRKLKLHLTQTWGVCMSLDSGMHWSQNQLYCDDRLESKKFRARRS